MNTAEIKLELFRWLDQQSESMLKHLYSSWVSSNIKSEKEQSVLPNSVLGYEAMSKDTAREKEALEWIEGTLNYKEL